jgi:hypothetical protein
MAVKSISTRNFQNGLTFSMQIVRLVESSFFITKASIPQISSESPIQETLFNPIPLPGTQVNYSELELTFLVQEGLRNWYDIFIWINGLNFPQSFSQYRKIKDARDVALDGQPYPPIFSSNQGNLYSDIHLNIYSSQGNPLLQYTFIDAFPVTLSGIELSATDETTTILTSSTTFKYSYFVVSDEF